MLSAFDRTDSPGRRLAVDEWPLVADIVEKVGCCGVGLLLIHFILRGPSGAKDEFLLAATAQNLRKLAKLIIPTMP